LSVPKRESFSPREKFAWAAVAVAFVVALWWHGRERPPARTTSDDVPPSAPAAARWGGVPFPAAEPRGEPGAYAGRPWQAGAAAWREALEELRRTGDPFLVYFYGPSCPECERVSRRYLEQLPVRDAIRAVTKVRIDVVGDAEQKEICRLLYPRPPDVRVVRLQPPGRPWDFSREETVAVPLYWPTGGTAAVKTPYEYGLALRASLADVVYRPRARPFPASSP
jgi:hypothetical protein